MRRFRQLPLFAACILVLVSPVASSAQTIIDEWSSVKVPPAPELKDATIDPKTTALLMLDFVKQNCNEKVRPRCPATLPAAKQLLAGARANNVLVVYGIVAGSVIGDTLGDVAPNGLEPVVQSGPDKFLNTELEKILKDRGIRTVVVAGTAANGAVLHTASEPFCVASRQSCPWTRCRRTMPTLSNTSPITSSLPAAASPLEPR